MYRDQSKDLLFVVLTISVDGESDYPANGNIVNYSALDKCFNSPANSKRIRNPAVNTSTHFLLLEHAENTSLYGEYSINVIKEDWFMGETIISIGVELYRVYA